MHLPEPELVYGVFTRALGVVFLVAFASLHRDVLPFAGRYGHTPLAPQLDAMRRDYPGLRRFLRFPTVFFLDASDRTLKAGTVVGMIAALLVIGGVGSTPALFVCWLLYLSYAQAFDFFYPWDLVLLEAGALSLFLPSLAPLPDLAATSAPLPPVAWAYRWLLFRVVFGFGKYKFFGPGKLHLDYLSSFMVSQPLSTPLGLAAKRHLPRAAFAVALGVLFLIEVPTPFLVFGPPAARLFAMGAIASLMIGIQLSGNFGFFNLATLVLCIPLLDADASIFDLAPATLLGSPVAALATAYAGFLLVAGLLCLPFDSWIAQAWPAWPSVERVPVLRWIAAFFRAIGPFHLVHAFGVFSPESGPPLKWVPVVEGTRDGTTWLPYRCRYMPSTADSPGRFVAPFMPRFDHALIYDALGISLSNYTASVFSVQNPYRFSRTSWMERLAQRLLEGRIEVRRLFLEDPFGDEPPSAVRVRLATFELDPDGHDTWRVRFVGTHLPPQTRDPRVFERWIPQPDCFHWDERPARRLSPGFCARVRSAEDPAALDLLFDELVPILRGVHLGDEDSLETLRARITERFDAATLDDLEAVVERVAWRVAERFEQAGAGESWFDLGLLARAAILDGRAQVERARRDPKAALAALRPVDLERGLRPIAAFRPDVLAFQARKARVRELTLRGAARDPHPIAPGFLRHLPALARYFPDSDEALVRYRREGHAWRRDDEPGAKSGDGVCPARSHARQPGSQRHGSATSLTRARADATHVDSAHVDSSHVGSSHVERPRGGEDVRGAAARRAYGAFGDLAPVQRTLAIPLVGRAQAARAFPELGFSDPDAARMVEALAIEGADRLARDRKFVWGTIVRTQAFDALTRDFAAGHPEGTVLNLGVGLCTRALRFASLRWIEVDRAEVIAVRNTWLPARPHVRRISADLADPRALAAILTRLPRHDPVLVLAEGVLMFLTRADQLAVLASLGDRLPAGSLIAFDYLHPWVSRLSSVQSSLRITGARYGSGLRPRRDLAGLTTLEPHGMARFLERLDGRLHALQRALTWLARSPLYEIGCLRVRNEVPRRAPLPDTRAPLLAEHLP